MSLRVWLPLTKDLRNQGLSDCAVEEITSPVFDSNGKLGKALSEGKIRIPASKVGDIFNNNTMTVAFWYNNNTSNTSGNHAICGFSGNTEGDTDAVRIWDFFNYSVPTQFHWSMGTLGGGSLANAFPANTWVHVCVTWSAPTLKIYLDGVLKYTGSGSSNYTFNKSYYISFGHTPQKLNDFRIYDHCLSPMEVKELAKGLVLHYPLNRNGWGQENLVVGSNTNSTSTNKWLGHSATGGNTSTIEIDETGTPCVKVTRDNVAQSSWDYLSYDNFLRGSIKTNTTYTVSFDCKPSVNGTISFTGFVNGNATNYMTNSTTTIQGNCSANKWNHMVYRCTTINSFADISTTGQVVYFSRSTSLRGTNVNVLFKNIKVEEGSIATPWCPNSSDALATTMGLNSTTEYDCSGFCNNGTRTGTFSWTSDTPKYAVSTKFNGAEVIVVPFTCGLISEAVTVACWGYESNWNVSTAERLLGAATNSSGWCIGDYGSENTLFAFYANGGYNVATGFKQLSTGWHHFVITFDGLNLIYYVDGQQFSKKTFSTKQVATGNYNINIGRHYGGSYNFKGNMSDVRIYATALSADDVKSLYQNCATIDPDGTIRGQIRS